MPYCPRCGEYITEREKKNGSHRCQTSSDVYPFSGLPLSDPGGSIPQVDNPSADPAPSFGGYGGGDFGGGGASGDYGSSDAGSSDSGGGGGDAGGGDGGGGGGD